MPKFLIKATYLAEGTKGLLKEGGTARRAAVQKLVEGAGGTLEAFYFAYGEADAIVLVDMPDANAALGVSLAVNATGAVKFKTIVLITPEEVDAAVQKTIRYRAPGQ